MSSKRSGADSRWISVQLGLQLLALVGGFIELLVFRRGFTLVSTLVSVSAGVVVVGVSVYILRRAKEDLAENLTIAPTPVAGGHLVDKGIYSIVRHPMYLGGVLITFGFALMVGSWLALAVAIVSLPFFVLKSRHEESLLETRYPTYAEYRRRVRSRIVPWIL